MSQVVDGFAKIKRLELGRKINALRVKRHDLQQLFWECTLRCNLHCRHCGSGCMADDGRGEMPLQDFLPVLDDIKRTTKTPVLVITTGGEPLLRKDICECGKEITRRGFYWGVVTNGMLMTETMFRELAEAGLKSISISLDGLREEHNWMRSHPQSFYKALHAIHLLATTPHSMTWDVITCVNKRNLAELEDMKELLIAQGVKRWKIFSVFPMGRATEHEEMELEGTEFRRLLDFIVTVRHEGTIKVSYGCENFLGPYEYEVRDGQYFCGAGINVASIRFDGSISGCLSIRSEYTEGNIYTDTFSEVWQKRFERYRHLEWKKTGICTDCEAWRWCEGNGMHLRDNDGHLHMCYYKKLYHNK